MVRPLAFGVKLSGSSVDRDPHRGISLMGRAIAPQAGIGPGGRGGKTGRRSTQTLVWPAGRAEQRELLAIVVFAVAELAFRELPSLLGFQAQRCDRARFEPP